MALLQLRVKLTSHHGRGSKQQGDDAVKRFAGRAVVLVLFALLFMMFRLRIMGGSMPTFYL